MLTRGIRLTRSQMQELLVRLGYTAQGATNVCMLVGCRTSKEATVFEKQIQHPGGRWNHAWKSGGEGCTWPCRLIDLTSRRQVGIRATSSEVSPAEECDYELVAIGSIIPVSVLSSLEDMRMDTSPLA